MRYGVWCERAASSKFGYAANWLNVNGVREEFDTRELAQARTDEIYNGLSDVTRQRGTLSYTVKVLP